MEELDVALPDVEATVLAGDGSGDGRVMAEADEMMDCASLSVEWLDKVSWNRGAVGGGLSCVSSRASPSEASQSSASVLWIQRRIRRMVGLW